MVLSSSPNQLNFPRVHIHAPTEELALVSQEIRLAALAAQSIVTGRKPQIGITSIEATPVREPVGGRTYVIVQVKTDAGITGVGETTAAESRLLVERLDQLKATLIEQDALR